MTHSVVTHIAWPFAKPFCYAKPSPAWAKHGDSTISMASACQQKGFLPGKCSVWGQGLLQRPGEKLGRMRETVLTSCSKKELVI